MMKLIMSGIGQQTSKMKELFSDHQMKTHMILSTKLNTCRIGMTEILVASLFAHYSEI